MEKISLRPIKGEHPQSDGQRAEVMAVASPTIAGGCAPLTTDTGHLHPAYRTTAYFSGLDGLRCIAILAVIWVHTGVPLESLTLTQRAYLGVDLFFAISGFLITTLLLRERERCGGISLKAFYIRRSLRIFPLYYTVIGLYIAFVWLLEPSTPAGRQFFHNLPYFLSYTSNWFVPLEGRVIFYFAWSLATEEQFYLVWPTVEKFMRGARAVWLAGGLLALRTTVEMAVHGNVLDMDVLWVRIILSIHPAILGGVLLAHLLHDRHGFGLAYPLLGQRWAAPTTLAALLLAIETRLPMGVIWMLMVILVGTVAIRETNGLARVLRWRPMVHIGMVSYGMYLMHMLSYHAVRRVLAAAGLDHQWLWFPVTVLAATLAATLSYRYYESWFLKLKDRYGRGESRTAARFESPQCPGTDPPSIGRHADAN